MTTSAVIEDMARRIIRGFVQSGARSGDAIDPNTLQGKIHFPTGQIANIPAAMDRAVEQGWLTKNDRGEYRLTDAGFAAGS
jgi:hypothetical protein